MRRCWFNPHCVSTKFDLIFFVDELLGNPMKLMLSLFVLFSLAVVASAQDDTALPAPVWELGRNAVAPHAIHGDIQQANGKVTVDDKVTKRGNETGQTPFD